HGGVCIGIACVVDRSKGTSPLAVIASAFALNLDTFTPEECPLCKAGKLELVKPGSRKMKV
ncbi:MAG: orotate phosphoribosyltransferase, partial [Ruthenibacterium sp.]